MNGRLLTTPLCVASALTGLLAVARLAGVDKAGPIAVGLGVAALNLAAMKVIFQRIVAPDADPGSKLVWGVIAALKFVVLAGIVYAAVARAGLDPALFAAGFAAALAVTVAWILLGALRAPGDTTTTQKGHAVCRTE